MLFERNLQEAVEGHTPVNLEAEPKEVRLLGVDGAIGGRGYWWVGLLGAGLLVGGATGGRATSGWGHWRRSTGGWSY